MTIEKLTRDEWIKRFAARMLSLGTERPEHEVMSIAEGGCDATEEAGGTDPDKWEAPETVADEHLVADGDVEDDTTAVLSPFGTDEGKWYVANGLGQVVSGPFDSADEAMAWISRQ